MNKIISFFKIGYKDFFNGLAINPYSHTTHKFQHDEWLKGWKTAQEDAWRDYERQKEEQTRDK